VLCIKLFPCCKSVPVSYQHAPIIFIGLNEIRVSGAYSLSSS
jgi:hypothetical protein